MSSDNFTLPAFAKINWSLRVLGRRPDGYHELHTVFQTITLHDTLTFESRSDSHLHLTCDVAELPVDQGNLIVQAADALRDRYGLQHGASIHLAKRIPIEAGLGGGSSDAASALLGLTHLWKIDAEKAVLEEIGATLGADVPFFFTGGTALGTGLGTDIAQWPDTAEVALLVVTAGVKVPTAEAYKALKSPALTKVLGDIILSSSRPLGETGVSPSKRLHNDFEPVIYALHPEIERVRLALLNEGAENALLAGSGAAVFGIFENVEVREHAEQVLSSAAGWRVFKCATLSRDSYLKELGACAAPLLRGHSGFGEFNNGA